MAMAIALAAVAAQAVDAYIQLNNVYRAGTTAELSGNGYLIYSDTLDQSAAVAAFYSAGDSSTLASSAELTWGVSEGYHFDFAEVSSAGAMYAVCFDQDSNNNYMYVSPVANPKWEEMMGRYTYKINAGGTSGAAAMSASDGWQGAGWYSVAATSNVPEPTSGLLMLLGVAGLALKRKRA